MFPEIAFDEEAFLAKVKVTVERVGYCSVVVSEGLKNRDGKFLAEAGTTDAFGHTQLGGVGPLIAQLVKSKLGYKYHWAVPDYLQRSARHLASKTDAEQAYAVGKAASRCATGKNAVMPHARVEQAVQVEDRTHHHEDRQHRKKLPPSYIRKEDSASPLRRAPFRAGDPRRGQAA